MSKTPRTDAIIESYPESAGLSELATQYNGLLDHARQLESELDAAKVESERYKRALAELVECKDLKDEMDKINSGGSYGDGGKYLKFLHDEYHRRKPLAWSAAYAALEQEKKV